MSGIIIKIYPLNKKVVNEDNLYIFDDFVYEYNTFIETNIWMSKDTIKHYLTKFGLLRTNDDMNSAYNVYRYLLKKMEETDNECGMIQYL